MLLQSGALQEVSRVTSRGDGREWRLQRRSTCTTSNTIYYILCPCATTRDYVGSTTDIKRRWSKHKTDIRKGYWDNCGLTKHFQHHHQRDLEAAITNLRITLVDHLVGPFKEEKLLQLEKDWILNMGTSGPTGLNSRNQLLTNQRRNWGNQ